MKLDTIHTAEAAIKRAATMEGGEVAALHVAIRHLACELSACRGERLDPQEGSKLIRLPLGEAEALVEYEISEDAERDDWRYPARMREVVVLLGALVNGRMVDMDEFSEDRREAWLAAIADHECDEYAHAIEEAA